MPAFLILLPEGNTGFLGVSVQLRHVSTFKAQATNGNQSDGQHNFFSANLGMDSLFRCLFGFRVGLRRLLRSYLWDFLNSIWGSGQEAVLSATAAAALVLVLLGEELVLAVVGVVVAAGHGAAVVVVVVVVVVGVIVG